MIFPVHSVPVAILPANPSAVKSITTVYIAENAAQLLDASVIVFGVAKQVVIPPSTEMMVLGCTLQAGYIVRRGFHTIQEVV